MLSQISTLDWGGFLGRTLQDVSVAAFRDLHQERCVLVTGAGGSIGSALARQIAQMSPRVLILLDAAEPNLFHVEAELTSLGSSCHIGVLGSVTDDSLVCELFERFRPELVYHAAAYKHVPLLEFNPLAAIYNNVVGTHTLARAASHFGAKRFVLVSTDKAVYPHSIMGASKRIAELAILAPESTTGKAAIVRLGNVLGSEGSVANIFLRQIEEGGPLTVSHQEARRYFLTMQEAVQSILSVARESACGIFVPEMGQPLSVENLAAYLSSRFAKCDIPVVYSGLRPGDKLREDLTYDYEVLEARTGRLRRYSAEIASRSEVLSSLSALCTSVPERNLGRVLELVCRLVPEYKPSDALLHLVSTSVVA